MRAQRGFSCKSPQKNRPFPFQLTATHMLVRRLFCCYLLLLPAMSWGQMPPAEVLALQDLSTFDPPPPGWQVAGGAVADLERAGDMQAESGTGMLVNLSKVGQGGPLATTWTHGDLDLSLEFMLPAEGKSGLHLMGRYPIQLVDSWGKDRPSYGDCGGMYVRWDDKRPDDPKSYYGHAPRLNACRAPGLWQHLEVAFRAPRFDTEGQKVENARILRMTLNGAVIHENVELSGPGINAPLQQEGPQGPLVITGHYGPVALRNIRYERFGQDAAVAGPFDYTVYLGKFRGLPNVDTLTVARQGQTDLLTQEVAGESEDFLLRLQGSLRLPRDGDYHFEFNPLGFGQLRIDGQVITPAGMWRQRGSVTLTAGNHQLDILYGKDAAWYNNGLALYVRGPQLRRQPLHVLSSMPVDAPTDPVYVKVGAEPRVMRCFIDYRDPDSAEARRIAHAINVGFPNGQSYTFDPDRAAWVQAWRGDFLDAGPMWISRGDGSARPQGSVLPLGDAAGLGLLLQTDAPWSAELPEALDYAFLGYRFFPEAGPSFLYRLGEATVRDEIRSQTPGRLTRSLYLNEELNAQIYLRLAAGRHIEAVDTYRYHVDQRYYIELLSKTKPLLRTVQGRQELLLPLPQGKRKMVSYQVIW